MATLRTALLKRGYPSTEHIPYDAEQRTVLLERLARRDDQVDTRKYDSRSKVLVFKTQYGSHIKALSIKKEISKLYNMLRQHIGWSFLQDTRTVIAYPASSNAFLRSYSSSFVPSTGPKKRGNRSG